MASIVRVREKGAVYAKHRNWYVRYLSGVLRVYKYTSFYDLPMTVRRFVCNAEVDEQIEKISGTSYVVNTYTAAVDGWGDW